MKTVIVISLAIILMACANPVGNFNYYQFDTPSVDAQSEVEELIHKKPVLLSLTVPDYLKQNKMVMEVGSGELQFADLHLWAELPARAIHNQIRGAINRSAGDWYATTGNHNISSEADMRIHINLTHFYPTTSGEVLLVGDWLFSIDGVATAKANVQYQQKLTEDGYASALAVKAGLINRLAREINQYLKHNLQQHKGNIRD